MFLEPVKSVVQFPFYREVTAKSAARAVGYLVYLSFLFSLAATASLYHHFDPALREAVDWACRNVPAVTFADGKATSASSVAVILHPPRIDKTLVIDTNRTDPVTADEMAKQGAQAYLTHNALYLMPSPEKLERYGLEGAPAARPWTLNADFFRAVGSALSLVLYPLAWFFTWLFFVCWKLLASLFYSVFGLALNAATGAGLPYESLFKIAVYAQTPVVLVQAVMLFAPREFIGFIIVAWLIVAFYTWQALRQHRAAGAGAGPAANGSHPAE